MKTLILLPFAASCLTSAVAAPHKLLFFTKSSGFEHSVISWKDGQPSHAENVFLELGKTHDWTFEFSKDGSKFTPEYLAQFDSIIFYTTGDLTIEGKDGQPPMTAEGKQAIFDYVKSGKGFIGIHSASDTFHTDGEMQKGPSRYVNHGEKADPYICFLGGEFITHGAQQDGTNKIVNPAFPGFENAGETFTMMEEWYSLKDFRSDIHALTIIDSPEMKGAMYERPPFPTTWARAEGDGRVYYTALGHREDVWTNELFQNMLVGAVKWTTGEVDAEIPANLSETAPGAMTNPEAPDPKDEADKEAQKQKRQAKRKAEAEARKTAPETGSGKNDTGKTNELQTP